MSRQVGASKNRKYSPSQLETAVKLVESGAMSKKKAALTYGIPRTTLIDKISGRYKLGSLPGRKTVLTYAEELSVVDYCKLMAMIGYPLKKDQLLMEVKKVLDHDQRNTPFKNNLPGKDWFYGFVKRHPVISQRTAMTLGHQRAMINKNMIDGWFGGLKLFLQKEVADWESMVKDPRRCFNADESGFPLCVNTGKVLAEKGAKHVYQVTSSTKQQITVMACFNAFGHYVPPLIVFPGERFRDSGIQEFPEAIYGQTQNGWMDGELFLEFLIHLNAFVAQESIQKPIILYVDGHSTHISFDAGNYCNSNDIVLYCLFPNATHVLQPCDVGFFGPMKSAWKKEVKDWHVENVGQNFTKRHFPGVFKKAWVKVAKLENALHGFNRCGLFPLDPNSIDVSKLTPSKLHDQAKVETPSSVTVPPAAIVATCTEPVTISVGQILPDVSVAESKADSPVSLVAKAPIATSNLPATLTTTVADTNLPFGSPVSSYLPGTCILSTIARSTETASAPASTCISASAASVSSLPGPRGACPPLFTATPLKVNLADKDSFVSPSFSLLTVPEIRTKKKANTIRQKLPKALSGTEALRIFKERETKKREEEEAKQRRKKEREAKKKLREQEKERAKKERDVRKKVKEEQKKLKEKRSRKRKVDESSSDSDSDMPKYAESEDEYDEMSLCPGCMTDDGGQDEWISCTACPRKWHITCTGDAVLLEIPGDQLAQYPFVCEYCIDN